MYNFYIRLNKPHSFNRETKMCKKSIVHIEDDYLISMNPKNFVISNSSAQGSIQLIVVESELYAKQLKKLLMVSFILLLYK